MDNNTWTPIFSGTTKKMIAGASGNNIYIFIENSCSKDGGDWAEIGCLKDNKVFSVSGSSKRLIGDIVIKNGEYHCYIDRSESINFSKEYCEENIKENEQSGLSTDFYKNKLVLLQKMMPRMVVARVLEPHDRKVSAVHIFEAGENFVDESRWHDVVLFARASYPDQDASPIALVATFLLVQFHSTFSDVDRPLKQLWDF